MYTTPLSFVLQLVMMSEQKATCHTGNACRFVAVKGRKVLWQGQNDKRCIRLTNCSNKLKDDLYLHS